MVHQQKDALKELMKDKTVDQIIPWKKTVEYVVIRKPNISVTDDNCVRGDPNIVKAHKMNNQHEKQKTIAQECAKFQKDKKKIIHRLKQNCFKTIDQVLDFEETPGNCNTIIPENCTNNNNDHHHNNNNHNNHHHHHCNDDNNQHHNHCNNDNSEQECDSHVPATIPICHERVPEDEKWNDDCTTRKCRIKKIGKILDCEKNEKKSKHHNQTPCFFVCGNKYCHSCEKKQSLRPPRIGSRIDRYIEKLSQESKNTIKHKKHKCKKNDKKCNKKCKKPKCKKSRPVLDCSDSSDSSDSSDCDYNYNPPHQNTVICVNNHIEDDCSAIVYPNSDNDDKSSVCSSDSSISEATQYSSEDSDSDNNDSECSKNTYTCDNEPSHKSEYFHGIQSCFSYSDDDNENNLERYNSNSNKNKKRSTSMKKRIVAKEVESTSTFEACTTKCGNKKKKNFNGKW